MNPCPKAKTERLKGVNYKALRRAAWQRAKGVCEKCGDAAPLYDADGLFDVFYCGHVAHIKSRGAGGADTLENVKWHCWGCHGSHHGPRWSR